jgi:hypothetical protein
MKREFKHSYIKMRLHFQKLWKENHEKKTIYEKLTNEMKENMYLVKKSCLRIEVRLKDLYTTLVT